MNDQLDFHFQIIYYIYFSPERNKLIDFHYVFMKWEIEPIKFPVITNMNQLNPKCSMLIVVNVVDIATVIIRVN